MRVAAAVIVRCRYIACVGLSLSFSSDGGESEYSQEEHSRAVPCQFASVGNERVASCAPIAFLVVICEVKSSEIQVKYSFSQSTKVLSARNFEQHHRHRLE